MRILGDRQYNGLVAERDEIEKALGIDVEWGETAKRLRVIARHKLAGIIIQENRHPAQAWLADTLNRFVNVFKPRIEKLIREGQ